MEFITKYSESVLNGTKQTFFKASMTEPDNSMSIPEIIAKFTRGQGLQVPVHEWTSGTAGDDSTDIEEFMNGKQPAPAEPAPVGPAPEKPASVPVAPAKDVVSGGPGESDYVVEKPSEA